MYDISFLGSDLLCQEFYSGRTVIYNGWLFFFTFPIVCILKISHSNICQLRQQLLRQPQQMPQQQVQELQQQQQEQLQQPQHEVELVTNNMPFLKYNEAYLISSGYIIYLYIQDLSERMIKVKCL